MTILDTVFRYYFDAKKILSKDVDIRQATIVTGMGQT